MSERLSHNRELLSTQHPMAFENLHSRIEEVLGKPMPLEHSIHGLDNLPPDVVRDAETIYEHAGSLLAFVYLFHVTDAAFGDVKCYCGSRGWATGVDE